MKIKVIDGINNLYLSYEQAWEYIYTVFAKCRFIASKEDKKCLRIKKR